MVQALQLTKLNRATYAILLDVSPIVDPENNVLQHYMESDIVQLGLWGNVVEKNMRVKGTDFENLGFSFELPKSLMGIRGAVRVMRVEYDHYSKVRKLSYDVIRDAFKKKNVIFSDIVQKGRRGSGSNHYFWSFRNSDILRRWEGDKESVSLFL